MSCLKRSALGALCVCAAMTAIATASSVATAEPVPHFIENKKGIVAKVAVESKINSFYIRVPSFSWKILCEGIDNSADIGPDWESKLEIEFTRCTIYNLEGVEIPDCAVEEPIKIDLEGQLVYKAHKEKEEVYDILHGAHHRFETPGIFATISYDLDNTCALVGEQPIRGSVIGLPKPRTPGEEAKSMKLIFSGESMPTGKYENQENSANETAGALTLAKDAAYLEGEIVLELPSGEKFGVE